jgi:hypothetical protein
MRWSDDRGQASPEWLGLVLLVALAAATAIAAGVTLPGLDVARAVGARIVCAAGIDSACGSERAPLIAAYGPELAALTAEHAPALDYEEGMRAVPVDFRSCREDACAEGPESGPVRASAAGEPVTAFVHAVDCRDPRAASRDGYECGGGREGILYLQYWLYYPGSQTSRELYGEKGFHPDDWESFQVRIGPEGTEARASSHHGYNGRSGDSLNDTGLLGSKAAWDEFTGRYYISGGSHAGRVGGSPTPRWTARTALRLIPVEPLAAGGHEFAVTPPWAKRVYRDPEEGGTG